MKLRKETRSATVDDEAVAQGMAVRICAKKKKKIAEICKTFIFVF